MSKTRSFYISHVRPALTVARMTFSQNVMDSFVIFSILVQPMLIALLALWMLKDKGSGYAVFVVVGSGMTGLWSSLPSSLATASTTNAGPAPSKPWLACRHHWERLSSEKAFQTSPNH